MVSPWRDRTDWAAIFTNWTGTTTAPLSANAIKQNTLPEGRIKVELRALVRSDRNGESFSVAAVARPNDW